MKKKFAIIVLGFLSILYILSSSGAAMREILSYRKDLYPPFSSDRYKYGDLYGFSYLKEFKIPYCSDPVYVQLEKFNRPRNINLYIVHDSYLREDYVRSDSIFCGVNKYYSYKNEKNVISLDTSKTNVLVIEIVERNLRNYPAKKLYLKNEAPALNETQANFYSSLKPVYWTIFNPLFNQNLEYNTFEYIFFTPLKEFKAQMGYKLFNRIDPMVVISSDRRYLYLSETIDTNLSTSSFKYVGDKEVNEIVKELNYKYQYYRSMGFREVYFSIIPNPVTILNTEKYSYNELIPKIQRNRNLKMPMIDIYSVFKKQNIQLYNRSDSHWTINGFHLWMNELNRRLSGLAAKGK